MTDEQLVICKDACKAIVDIRDKLYERNLHGPQSLQYLLLERTISSLCQAIGRGSERDEETKP